MGGCLQCKHYRPAARTSTPTCTYDGCKFEPRKLPGFFRAIYLYLKELERQVVYSTSHVTLHRLYITYGKTDVNTTLDRYFERTKCPRS